MRFNVIAVISACAAFAAAAPLRTYSVLAKQNVIRPTVNYQAGFNAGAYTDSGACKSSNDWVNELRMIKSWSNAHFSFTTVKIYTTQQCDTLNKALAAAAQVGGIKIWAGLWTTPASQFELDKGALSRAIQGNNGNLIAGVSVGSEELLRGTPENVLAGYIWDVKGMIQNAYGKKNVPVGTSDGSGNLRSKNAVTDACDYAMITDYPYYGGAHIDKALDAFKGGVSAVKAVFGNRPVMIGETGWPTGGNTIGAALPSVDNARKYWKAAACWLRSNKITFIWFSDVNELWKPLIGGSSAEHNFGVGASLRADMKPKFLLTC